MLQILYVYLSLTLTLDTGCGSSALPRRGHSPPPPVSPDAQLVFLPKRSACTHPTRLPRHLRWLPLMISRKGRRVQQVFSGAMTHLPEPTPFQSCPHDSKLVYSIYLFIALGTSQAAYTQSPPFKRRHLQCFVTVCKAPYHHTEHQKSANWKRLN